MTANKMALLLSLLLVAGCGGAGASSPAAPDLATPPVGLDDGGVLDLAMATGDQASSPADLWSPDMAQPTADLACTPMAGAKRIFVTSLATTGNLMAAGNGTNGLDGGDRLCAAAAAAATLGGSWKAWLSSSSVNAIDRVADVGPWYLVDRCTLVFANKAAMVVTGPAAAIDRRADGSMAPPVDLWTGTKATGVKDAFTCNDWTNDQPIHGYEGTVGIGSNLAFAGSWTETATDPCHLSAVLICIEQ
jgi:hypothetical protein